LIGEALPEGGAATLSKEFILEVVGSVAVGQRDLTVVEVAGRFGRSESTIRSWISQGALRAYRLRGRAWRIPPSAIADFEAAEMLGREAKEVSRPHDVADLSAWRSAS
jgi:excisionase family DNA binding protein